MRIANATLAELGLEKHPEKTFIGPVARGFDFLGYRFRPEGLELAPAAVRRRAQRIRMTERAQLWRRHCQSAFCGTV